MRNVVEIGRGKAFFSEHLQRSVDDLAGPRLLASAPFRFVIRRSRKHRRAERRLNGANAPFETPPLNRKVGWKADTSGLTIFPK